MKFRALFLGVLGLIYVSFSHGQTLEATDTIRLGDIENIQSQWIDLNHDLSYDLFVWGKSTDGDETLAKIYLNDGSGAFTAQTVLFPDVIIHQLQFKDFNRDRVPDLIFAGVINGTDSVLSVILGSEDFNYQLRAEPLINEPVEQFSMLDINYDTREDLMIGQRTVDDSLKFSLLKGVELGFEATGTEFPMFGDLQLYTFDLDSNGVKDFVFSGITKTDTLTQAFSNLGNFVFVESPFFDDLKDNLIDNLTIGEFNQDQLPDLFIASHNANSNNQNTIYSNGRTTLTSERSILEGYQVKSSLMVDFDSEGTTDLWLETTRNDSTYIFWQKDIADFSDTTGIFRDSLISTSFADLNLDGHIDYMELQQGVDSLELIFFINELEDKNDGPLKPLPQVAVQTGRNELKVSWQNGTDSLTHTSSISYDALLMDADTTVLFEANTSTANFWPMIPAHGNQLYSNELNLIELPPGDYFYLVRGIDNAFNFFPSDGASEELELGKVTICDAETVVSNVDMCNGSIQVFGTLGVQRNWYSDRIGAIGVADLMTYQAGGVDDVIYGSVTESGQCSQGQLQINVTILDGGPNVIPISPSVLVCNEQELTYELPNEWSDIRWSSSTSGNLGTANSLTINVTQSDTLFVQATNPLGCIYRAQSIIQFSEFNPAVRDSVIKINSGDRVVLNASGGTRYIWDRGETLNNPFTASPIASPRETTLYTVIIQNAVGCFERLTVRVEVPRIAFAADMFSPNGDNRNDLFFLQLSSVPTVIDFRIYNREGNIVYQERDGSRVVTRGWDGTFKGEKLPPGVYYWQVRGFYSNGEPVVVNDDNSGKVHLIR